MNCVNHLIAGECMMKYSTILNHVNNLITGECLMKYRTILNYATHLITGECMENNGPYIIILLTKLPVDV